MRFLDMRSGGGSGGTKIPSKERNRTSRESFVKIVNGSCQADILPYASVAKAALSLAYFLIKKLSPHMTFLRISAVLAIAALQADAQTTPASPPVQNGQEPLWDVSIPEAIVDDAAQASAEEPTPVVAPLISSHTVQKLVTEPPPMPGLPAITGPVTTTLQVIAAPDLPEPPPLPALPPDSPEVRARFAQLSQIYQGTEFAFVSVSVYDNHRAFLRIYPNGQMDQEVSAWSNVDFNVFTGWSTYRIHHGDGTYQVCGLLMGISDVQTATMQSLAAKAGTEYRAPVIPTLPDLAAAGPAFQVVSGTPESAAMDTLEQLHDLFRKEGNRMKAAHLARKQAETERRAYLLANPPQPANVTIRYWKGEPNTNRTEVSE